jgi:phospholipid/cholesterol/gamma-HCH transport system substrate-binding protein
MKISNEFKIGFWALVALLVLFFGIDYLKGINRFRPGKYYYMTCSNVEGLTVSGHVMLNGYKVGLVRSMSYDRKHPGQVLVEIKTCSAQLPSCYTSAPPPPSTPTATPCSAVTKP